MQTQALVQPPRLAFQKTLPGPPRLVHREKPPVQSRPALSPTLRALLDHPPPTSQQRLMSTSDPSRPAPCLAPSHSHSPSDSTSCPSTGTRPSPHFSTSSSPPQIRPTPLFPPPYSAPHHQNHFASSATSYPPNMDRYSIANLADRYLRDTDKYPHNQHPLLDQRRMSEPAMYGNAASGYPTSAANLSSARHHQFQHECSYMPPRSYAGHSSPLHPSDSRPTSGLSWKEDHQLPLHPYDPVELEEPLSPLNPTFSGGESPPPTGMSGVMFGPLHDDYGPSPPGTGTSTSSTTPDVHQHPHTSDGPSSAPHNKQYSFVSLPGNEVRKRPRRRYDEIERLYQCSWPNCTKAYGTLNHLNAHITMQKHGPKRSPNEFKELRKQWRKAKKEEAETRALDEVRRGSHQTQHPSHHHHTFPQSMSNAEYQPYNVYSHHPARSAPVGPLDDPHDTLAPQRDVYSRRSQRYDPLVSPHPQHSGIAYPHPHAHGANTSTASMNRLPANSTLLTPLPGYASSSMSGSPDFVAYDSYGVYRGSSRPRASHGSPTGHDDRGQTRSSHANTGIGHNHDCP